MENYAKHDMFKDGMGNFSQDEFDDARQVVSDLSAEYQACEQSDYIDKMRA